MNLYGFLIFQNHLIYHPFFHHHIIPIAQKYNVSFEQAAGIVAEVQTDTINTIKSSSDQVGKKISNQVISSLNNKVDKSKVL